MLDPCTLSQDSSRDAKAVTRLFAITSGERSALCVGSARHFCLRSSKLNSPNPIIVDSGKIRDMERSLTFSVFRRHSEWQEEQRRTDTFPAWSRVSSWDVIHRETKRPLSRHGRAYDLGKTRSMGAIRADRGLEYRDHIRGRVGWFLIRPGRASGT